MDDAGLYILYILKFLEDFWMRTAAEGNLE